MPDRRQAYKKVTCSSKVLLHSHFAAEHDLEGFMKQEVSDFFTCNPVNILLKIT
jgi:hypothetical protein